MKISVVSEFRAGYSVGLEQSYARAFQRLGHSTTRHATPSSKTRIKGLQQVVELSTCLREQDALRREVLAASPDLVVVIKGVGILGRTVATWRAQGIRVVNVFPDNPFDAAGTNLVGRTLLGQFREVDTVFVHDRFAAGQLRQLGIPAEFIAFARDPEIHCIDSAPPSSPANPIVFIGNPDSERIRFLRAVQDLGLGLYGNWQWAGLAPDDPLMRCVQGGVQLGSDMVRVMRSARMSINILRRSQKTAHNMRTFETPACGVCSLSEDSVGVQEVIGSDTAAFFGTPAELRAVAMDLLKCPSEIDSLAERGLSMVARETYLERAKFILDS
ncbi:MAG: glycosyltransferase [Myxococcales bacterium]|nr:glycosyltransferase [Myxococcales bacterium]